MKKAKRPLLKRWWFWVLTVFVAICLAGALGDGGLVEEPVTSAAKSNPTEEPALMAALPASQATEMPRALAEQLTTAQRNALRSAESYLSMMSFSRDGLIEQLQYEHYSAEDAAFAVDNCEADWMEQAASAAVTYLRSMPFSYGGLVDQLVYDKFTGEQATYGADSCDADWGEQAALAAKNYLDMMAFSRDGLIEQLVYDGYTQEQAEYGASKNGY